MSIGIGQNGGKPYTLYGFAQKYTTYALGYGQSGTMYLVPLVTASGSVTIGAYKYSYDPSAYPRFALPRNGTIYYVVNKRTEAVPEYGTLKPAAAAISATSYGAWTTYQWTNAKRFSYYRTASATVSVTSFAVQAAGQKYAAGTLKASGSSGYASAGGSTAVNATYTSASIGTKSISVSATTSYRPSAGTAPGGAHYIVSIPLSITLSHTNSGGATSSALSLTWPSVDLNYWE